MWLSRYICLFFIYSLMGWIYETLYCTIKSSKWQNRGFLYGPACPIYGTGAVAISLVMRAALANVVMLHVWHVFLIAFIGSACLEYLTSWGLEKLFHAAWWDYSDLPLNLHGRISLFTSLGFGIAGLLVVYSIAPFTENAVDRIIPIAIELLSLCFIFAFAVDLTLTVTVLYHFDKMVVRVENSFNQSMENIVDTTVQRSSRVKNSIIEKGRLVNDQVSSMNGLMKSTIRRIHLFRDRDENRKTVKNRYLTRLKNLAFSRSRADEE